jgi:hypothetical protein
VDSLNVWLEFSIVSFSSKTLSLHLQLLRSLRSPLWVFWRFNNFNEFSFLLINTIALWNDESFSLVTFLVHFLCILLFFTLLHCFFRLVLRLIYVLAAQVSGHERVSFYGLAILSSKIYSIRLFKFLPRSVIRISVGSLELVISYSLMVEERS